MPEDDRPGRLQQEYLWPDERRGPYLLRLTLVQVRDRVEVVGVELWGDTPPEWDVEISGDREAVRFVTWGTEVRRRWESAVSEPEPIRATTIRLPLERLAQDVLGRVATVTSIIRSGRTPLITTSEGKRIGGKPFSDRAKRLAAAVDESSAPKRGRPAVYGDEHYEAVAKVYAEAHANRHHPTQAVQEHYSVSKSQAAKWVAAARRKGFLAPTRQGVPAGPAARSNKASATRRTKKGTTQVKRSTGERKDQ